MIDRWKERNDSWTDGGRSETSNRQTMVGAIQLIDRRWEQRDNLLTDGGWSQIIDLLDDGRSQIID